MKYGEKRASKKLKKLLLILLLLLIVLAGAALFAGMDKKAAEDMPAETTIPSTEDTVPEQTMPENDGNDLAVSTPYCDLYYPAEWKNRVRTEAESTAYGYTVKFFGSAGNQEAELFAVFFADASDSSFPIGMITYNGVSLDVNLEIYDLPADGAWSAEETEALNAMQESVNYLIGKLEEAPGFAAAGSQKQETESNGNETAAENKTEADHSDLVVSTEFCDLYFPAAWKQAVSAQVIDQEFGAAVVFYGSVGGKEAKLFTVFFADASDESFPIGVLTVNDMSVDVSLALHEPAEVAGWEQLEADTFYALQEQSNYLTAKLRTNEAFTALDG